MKSLEQQLQTSLIIVMSLVLFTLLVIANLSTRNLLQGFVSSRLEHDATRLLETLIIDSGVARVQWRRIDPIYNRPSSGHYYAITLSDPKNKERLLSSPSLQDNTIPSTLKTDQAEIFHAISGPRQQRLIVWSKQYYKNKQKVIVSVAEDMSTLMDKRKQFRMLFIIMAVVGFVLILVLQRIIIRRLFKHLDHTREEIQQITLGESQQLSEQVPSEIYPLVREFNHSLATMQQRMERSRHSLGNLAHALKTPLTLLIQQLDHQENKQGRVQAERIQQLMERELKRARMAGLGNTMQRFNPEEELLVLSHVLKQAHAKQKLQIVIEIGKKVPHFGDREDMLELFGNLLDNACKWATSKVICTVSIDTFIQIIIEDDGLGRSKEEIIDLTQRGIRVDESIQGHGLGLAICKDIVTLYAGSLRFSRSNRLGGFQVDVLLPIDGGAE
jgi:signal transduction histidine kinase